MIRKFLRAASVVLFVVATFSACGKEDGSNTIFTPDKDLTQAEIVRLLADAQVATDRSEEISVVEFYRNTKADGKVESYKYVYSNERYSFGVKKNMGITFVVDGSREYLAYFRYTENFIEYYYDAYAGTGKEKYLLTDAYYDRTDEEADYEEELNEMQWKVEGNMLVGTVTYTNANYPQDDYTETVTVTLTGKKKLQNVKTKYEYLYPWELSEYDATYTYRADFTFPAGIVLSDFTALQQYRVTVRWGAEAGNKTNVFYTDALVDYDGDGVIDGSYLPIAEVAYYAPKVAGKRPTFYLDATFTHEIREGNIWDITDNSTVVYVKWVAAPAGYSSAKSAKQADPRRKEKAGKTTAIFRPAVSARQTFHHATEPLP
jgi:hypothetical protein